MGEGLKPGDVDDVADVLEDAANHAVGGQRQQFDMKAPAQGHHPVDLGFERALLLRRGGAQV